MVKGRPGQHCIVVCSDISLLSMSLREGAVQMLLCGHMHTIQLSSALTHVCSRTCAWPCAQGGPSEGLLSSPVQWELALRCALLAARAPAGSVGRILGYPGMLSPRGAFQRAYCSVWSGNFCH